jgi:hypothetical protein
VSTAIFTRAVHAFLWLVFLAHPDDVERVLLASHKSFEKGVLWSRLKIVLGDGYDQRWRSVAKPPPAMQPRFIVATTGEYARAMQPAIERMLRRWQGLERGGQASTLRTR